MAEGGRVKEFDTREYYMPNAHKGQGGWPRIMAPESGPGWSRTLGAEMMRRQKLYTGTPDIRVDRANFQQWLAAQPRSTNIEDRRYYDPTRDEASAGPPAFQTGGALRFAEWGQEDGYQSGGEVGPNFGQVDRFDPSAGAALPQVAAPPPPPTQNNPPPNQQVLDTVNAAYANSNDPGDIAGMWARQGLGDYGKSEIGRAHV